MPQKNVYDDPAQLAKEQADPFGAAKPDSYINRMKKPDNRRPKDLGLHGQPGQYGRRYPLNRK
jgi:hypothetical protein